LKLVGGQVAHLPKKSGQMGGLFLRYSRQVVWHSTCKGSQFISIFAEDFGYPAHSLGCWGIAIRLFDLRWVRRADADQR
jgi:hypothetical protein